jgi:hypothetical protein
MSLLFQKSVRRCPNYNPTLSQKFTVLFSRFSRTMMSIYACLVSAFSTENAWKDNTSEVELREWANGTAVDMDWNRLQKRLFLDRLISQVVDLDEDEASEDEEGTTAYQKLPKRISNRNKEPTKTPGKNEDSKGMEFFVTETVERQISLGENLLEIVFPDISIDTENEVCP